MFMSKISKKIMIVDDEPAIREILTFTLSEYQIVEACDGIEALKKIDLEKPDLIISDVRMPNMGGIELIKKIREKEIKIPFMFITGHKTNQMINEVTPYNVFAFLFKPIEYDELELLVKSALNI